MEVSPRPAAAGLQTPQQRDDGLLMLPLNSRRLTLMNLQQIARGLGLPTAASGDELRQMISGKLEEMERDPPNVQVQSQRETDGRRLILSLYDERGRFLLAPPLEDDRDDVQRTMPQLEDDGEEEEEDGDPAAELTALRQELEQHENTIRELREEVSALEEKLGNEKARVKELWRMNCRQLDEHDQLLAAKDEELETLRSQLHSAFSTRGTAQTLLARQTPANQGTDSSTSRGRRGKAPPVDSFTGESSDTRLDDWLPSLKRAAEWNDWTEAELLMQLAGHLRGRALQEWNLLDEETERATYDSAVGALRNRLDTGSKTLAAQDFRHIAQAETESVTDFIRRLERTFRVAYGQDRMSVETRETLLYGQLQEGLSYHLIKSPAVAGAQDYKQLCTAAKNEERRLSELKKRQQYYRVSNPSGPGQRQRNSLPPPVLKPRQPPMLKPRTELPEPPTKKSSRPLPRCYNCGSTEHLARNCHQTKTESRGPRWTIDKAAGARTVRGGTPSSNVTDEPARTDPMTFLASSSDSEEEADAVRSVRVADAGSHTKCVRVLVNGVPVFGLVDSGADISIIGGDLFQRVAARAKLKKRDFKRADKVPHGYDRRPFTLDGRMDLDLEFNGYVINTPVYIKMDAHDQLLLSEGVCRQLGILKYHPDVQVWRGGSRKRPQKTSSRNSQSPSCPCPPGPDNPPATSSEYPSASPS